MGYVKPTCACGKELHIHNSYGVEDYYAITNDGKQAERKISKWQLQMQVARNLECRDCLSLYVLSFDASGRIIREGDHYRKGDSGTVVKQYVVKRNRTSE